MSVLENNLEKIIDKIDICTYLTKDILGIKEPEKPSLEQNILYKLNTETTFNTGVFIDTKIPQASMVNGYTIVIRMYSYVWENYTSLFGDYGMSNDHRGIVGLQYVSSSSQYGGDSLTFRHYLDDKPYMIGIPRSYVPVNQYHIVVCSYDGGHTGKLYVGDTLIKTNEIFANLVPKDNLIIGRSAVSSGDNRYFKGKISHFILYDKCLSQAEITEVVSQIRESVGE